MPNPFVIALGKAVQHLARLRGSGSAFPGLVVQKIEPAFAVGLLNQLPHGVVLVSGTNGKTTTTKIVTELLQSQGFKVFSNPTGSNFMRGVISALLAKVTLTGKLDANIAVLELDEAHAVRFVELVKPRYTLLLNVMRDQLDRFGEIDYTARLLATVAQNTTQAVVINREDSRLATLPATAAPPLAAQVYWYGLAPHLAPRFPQDDDLYRADDLSESWANDVDGILPAATVTLTALDSTRATFDLDGSLFSTPLQLKGIYNTYNAAAALALVRVILQGEGKADGAAGAGAGAGTGAAGVAESDPHLIHTLAQIKSAFGRGEALTIDGCEIELFLVKNPGGFRLALESFDPTGHDTMIAINDEYADGRDMSWLFDVGFATLRATGVAMVSGVRAYDMALRLHYDEVPFATVDTTLATATNAFLAQSAHPKRIYCTYTAMLAIRKHLATRAHLSKVV